MTLGLGIPELLGTPWSILLSHDFSQVLVDVILSILLFAGALEVNLRKLREEKWPILTLATAGVLLSTFLVGTLAYWILPWLSREVGYVYCLLFGALISPTDPIAVLPMVLAGTQVAHRLQVLAPLAMVAMGIFVEHSGRPVYLAEVAGSYVHKFWHVVDVALNTILFVLIGLEVLIIP